jgi:hypothetical protein
MDKIFVNSLGNFSIKDLTTLHWCMLSYLFYYFLNYITKPDKYIVIVTNLENSKVKIYNSTPLNHQEACDHYNNLVNQFETQVYNTFKGRYKVEMIKHTVSRSYTIN